MRHLFLRIFLWFWAAMAGVAAVLIVSSPLFTRSRPAIERWQRNVERSLAGRVERAAGLVATGRTDFSFPDHRDDRRPAPVLLLTPDGIPVAGPPPPPEVAAFARRVAAADEAVSEREGTLHLMGRPATTPDGTRMVVVAAVRRPPRLVDLLDPGFLGWRLALVTVLVGGVCLWLARTLTRPVTALRGTARRLADGDLTARVSPPIARRRDEIGDLARDFDAMAARLEALLGSQRRLLRDVSHELRSPLARLAVALELARSRAGEAAGEHLDRIGLEGERLEALVEQLLTLSRLESADGVGESEDVDLAALAVEVAADASFEAAARGVSVATEADPESLVRGDPQALRSAVENVVRNAVAFTADGSVVRVTVRATPAVVTVGVADQGPGVAEADLQAMFEPFFRSEDARERGPGGAGLGLAITSRVVGLHGGSVAARNRAERGLEITLTLPRTPGEPVLTG
ncbi:MAG: sensor histidine kinase [Acidobacteriota bacterium]